MVFFSWLIVCKACFSVDTCCSNAAIVAFVDVNVVLVVVDDDDDVGVEACKGSVKVSFAFVPLLGVCSASIASPFDDAVDNDDEVVVVVLSFFTGVDCREFKGDEDDGGDDDDVVIAVVVVRAATVFSSASFSTSSDL